VSDRPPRSSRALSARPRTAARAPSAEARKEARTIALAEASAGSVAAIMATLPDPAELAPGTLVIVPGEPHDGRSFARSVLAVFGRTRKVPRALRCSALVARGYVAVGAATPDDDAHADLAWGYAPEPPRTRGDETGRGDEIERY
jgi:hypothetical protein